MRGDLLHLGLGDPRADHGGVTARVDARAVAGDLGVVLGDAGLGGFGPGLCRGIFEPFGLFGDLGYRRVNAVRVEEFREPVIDVAEHVCFFEVDVLGVADAVGQGVLGGVAARVIGLAVVPLAAHLPAAQAAVQDTAQRVGAWPGVRLVLGLAAAPGEDRLGEGEVFLADDLRVCLLVGADPFVGRVPALLGCVAEGDVLDVEQDFVGALPVPYLVAGVAGIGQDRADGGLGPRDARPVRVARGVVRGRAGDTVAREALGNGEDAPAGEELGEDALDNPGCIGVEVEPVQPLAVCSLGGVRVRPRVRDQVPVGRAPAEETALDLRLRGHGGTNADLDPVPLALAHPAEHRHHQVVGLVARVDRPADLGHPQRDAVVVKDREGEPVLVSVERTVRFADHDRVEVAGWVLQLGEQRGCLRAALPRDRAGLVHVEELGDDHPATPADQRTGAGELPSSR